MPSNQPQTAPFPGSIRQISFVVPDIDAAIQDWLNLGVGPWFVLRQFRAEGSTYRGTTHDPVLSLGFANSGELQIELVAPEDDTPSIYREFLDSGRQGFHHIAYWTPDVPAAYDAASEHDWPSVQSGSLPFHYFQVSKELDLMVETSSLNERMTAISDAVRAAARDWDGVDRPVRPYPPS